MKGVSLTICPSLAVVQMYYCRWYICTIQKWYICTIDFAPSSCKTLLSFWQGCCGPLSFAGNLSGIGIVVRILLANQDPVMRSSLGILIKAQLDLEVVGESAEVSQLLSDVRTHHPDVVVLDFDLRGMQIDVLLEMLRSLDQPPAVVGMSVRAERQQAVIEAGADAFAYKGDPPDRLLSAIRTVSHKRG